MRLREPHCPTAGRDLHTGHVASNSRAAHNAQAIRLANQRHGMPMHNAQAIRLANQRHGMPMHGAATVGEPQYPCFPRLSRLSHGGTPKSMTA